MSTKERRKKLFRGNKPYIRELNLINANGYGEDMAVLWAAYKTGSFDLEEGLTQPQFADTIQTLLAGYNVGWMIEDSTAKLNSGAVALVLGNENGYELEPEFYFFSWATPRSRLRSFVQFLTMIRYSKDFGLATINGLDKDKKFLNRIERYGVLKFLATLPKGDPNGNRHIYYTHGRA